MHGVYKRLCTTNKLKIESGEFKMVKKCGIYKITCKENGKVRIGHTKGDFKKRFSNYRALLRHNNCDIKEMQEDWGAYGEESFVFEPIENCLVDELLEAENYWIIKYDAIENGYNDNLNDLSKKKKVRRGKEAANYRKKRSALTSGEKNGNAKLSKDDIFNILTLRYVENVPDKDIAKKFDISKNYLNRIGNDRWNHEYWEWQFKNMDIVKSMCVILEDGTKEQLYSSDGNNNLN